MTNLYLIKGFVPEMIKKIPKEEVTNALALVLGAVVVVEFLKIVNSFVNPTPNSCRE